MKELAHYVGQYHQLPEEIDGEGDQLESCVFGFECCRMKSTFGLVQDLQVTTEQPQMVVCDPGTQKVTPEGTVSLLDWI